VATANAKHLHTLGQAREERKTSTGGGSKGGRPPWVFRYRQSMTSPSTPAAALADEFVGFRLETEHDWALWAGDLTYLERWPDLSEAGVAERLERLESFSGRAEVLTPASPQDALLIETIVFTGRSQAQQLRWQPELEWVNHATGIVPQIFTFLPRYPLVTAEHGERYLEKLRALPAFVEQWTERLRASEVAPIAHIVSSTIATFDRHLAGPLSSGPLGRQLAPAEIDAFDAEDWERSVHGLLDTEVASALDLLRSVLRDHTASNARPDEQPGLTYLDDGRDHYERLVWAHTSIDVSAEDVHRIGLDEVARLDDEYRSIAGPLIGTEDLAAIYRALRDDPALHYTDVDTLVADAATALAKATAAAADWFGVLPQAPCTANAIEQGALAFYSRPAADGSKPGRFFFNTADPSMWGTFQLEAVTYHEGVPGHHLQLAIAQENAAMHPLLADYYVAAYNEGWGLYTERLADEMGLYSSELDRVGMLSADSMRACRLVVDTGMHALGWSRHQAIDYMLANSPLTETQVVGEIDRYIGNPGQALGYMMGRLEIERMRADAETMLGDRFDIRSFHDTVLSTGSVPISTLKRVVERWADA
jgi:uncharacterized protein (DUF885 family)